MFEEFNFENIMERMLSSTNDKFDKREGSIIFDAIAPVALELSQAYQALSMIVDESFADTASYQYLAKRAAERGLFPFESTHAIIKASATPTDSNISVNDKFFIDDKIFTVTRADEDVDGMWFLTADKPGIESNVTNGNLVIYQTENDLNDLESFSIYSLDVPGEDEEEQESFRVRYFSSFNNDAFCGNKSDYISRVNAISGVGGCKVVKKWNQFNPLDLKPNSTVQTWYESLDSSDYSSDVWDWLTSVYTASNDELLVTGGTIDIYIISSNYTVPTNTLVTNVQNIVNPSTSSGEGTGLSPIGHIVTIKPVIALTLDIALDIDFNDDNDFSYHKSDIESVIDAYFNELNETWQDLDNIIVRNAVLQSRLLALDYVADITSLEINSTSSNITLNSNQICERGTVDEQ